ncbi:uncharacterized protein PG998_013755 [Apiospora kogelbergensis]|uniref:uncharacterized protein n=1 Tax=Apiospora kogelbergensis TaxID=1337665 RepID=UPI00312E24F3
MGCKVRAFKAAIQESTAAELDRLSLKQMAVFWQQGRTVGVQGNLVFPAFPAFPPRRATTSSSALLALRYGTLYSLGGFRKLLMRRLTGNYRTSPVVAAPNARCGPSVNTPYCSTIQAGGRCYERNQPWVPLEHERLLASWKIRDKSSSASGDIVSGQNGKRRGGNHIVPFRYPCVMFTNTSETPARQMPYLPPEIWVIIFRSLANSQDFAAIWNNGRCASPYFKTLIESVFRIDILPVMVTNLSLVGCTARRGVERVLLDFKGLSGDGERAYFGEKNQATKGTGGPELQHKGDRRGLSANQSSNIAPGLPCSPPILIEWTSHFCISVARGPTSFVGKHGGAGPSRMVQARGCPGDADAGRRGS